MPQAIKGVTEKPATNPSVLLCFNVCLIITIEKHIGLCTTPHNSVVHLYNRLYQHHYWLHGGHSSAVQSQTHSCSDISLWMSCEALHP